jgi:hypothetical protein
MARGARSAMCRSIPKRSSPASCSRTSATPCSSSPIPALYDTVIVTSICACRRRRACRSAAAEGNQRRANHRHRRAGLRRADACGSQGRAGRRDAALCPQRSRSRAPCRRRERAASEPDGDAGWRDVPRRSGRHRHDAVEPLGLAAGPVGADARVARTLYAALDCARRCDSSVLHRLSVREFEAAPAAPSSGSAPVGRDGTAAWLDAIGAACNVIARDQIDAAKNALAAIKRGARRQADPRASRFPATRARTSGGAAPDRERRRGALCRHRLPAHALVRSRPRMARSQRARVFNTAHRSSRTSAGGRGMFAPGSRHRHHPGRAGRQAEIDPALYFTNLISARPLMGAAGAGSLAQVVNSALANKAFRPRCRSSSTGRRRGPRRRRVDARRRQDRPDSRSKYAKQQAQAHRKSEEAI